MSGMPDVPRFVTFRLGAQLFAADIEVVERILRCEAVRAIPEMPPWMEGVIDHSGAVVPVIDLRRRFNMDAPPPGPQTRLMICTTGAAQAALVVDAVLDVRAVPRDEIVTAPPIFRGLGGEYLKGLTRRMGELVVILDFDRVLSFAGDLHLEEPGSVREPA